MHTLVKRVSKLVPAATVTAGKDFYWSPRQRIITYRQESIDSPEGQWALIHEAAHAKLGHQTYHTDYELLQLEVAAWYEAEAIAKQLGVRIDPEHIQDCLDTYRDWLYRRSICPTCTTKCLQQSDLAHYRCFNCHTIWKVTPSRFCRAYRSTKNVRKSPALFHATERL